MSSRITIVLVAILFFPLQVGAAEWDSFISAEQLQDLLTEEPAEVIVIDARAEEEYLKGHIPSALNLPGSSWRTSKVKPHEGKSQYLFRTTGGQPDVERYEKFLGKAGISEKNPVVVYGNHAGKTDGSIPALILHWLGHSRVYFLDGIGVDEWKKEGLQLSKKSTTRPAVKYHALAKPSYVWQLKDVIKNLNSPEVVFYDTRSNAEFNGKELRSNRFGGHIPGAVLIDYSEFLDGAKKVRPKAEIAAILKKQGITPEKQVVLYCQTATRVSLPALALRDLGYEKVSVYDASWHEYGNRDTTPIAFKVEATKVTG